MTPISLTGHGLSLAQVGEVARARRPVTLSREARVALERGHALIRSIVAEGRAVYGVNTGFGALSGVAIDGDRLGELQLNLLRSHAAGVGAVFPPEVVRAMLLLRANTLSRGHSGVRPVVVERLLEMLAMDLLPLVPSQGSVGASGDLAPLAHLALPLLGEGQVTLSGACTDAATALATLGLEPLALGPKEGLALINGTQASTAVATLALLDAECVLQGADVAGALSVEALCGRPSAFDARIQALRPLDGQVQTAQNLRLLLEGSGLTTHASDALQDPYCLRCMPQVHGASRESAGFARRILAVEVNAVTDNPLLFPAEGEVLSGGNFHAEPVAQALDVLAIGMASLAAISERRLDRLLSGGASGLPLFLTANPGLHSGFMMAQVTAAALVAEARVLAHPASVDSIPTSAGKEDHVSFATHAARKAHEVVGLAAQVVGAEILAAVQALDLRGLERASPAARAVAARLRAEVPHLGPDRMLAPDLAAARALVLGGSLLAVLPRLD